MFHKTKKHNKKIILQKKNTLNKTVKMKSDFTAQDYNNKNGFQTAVWGPIFWSVLHMVSFNYPPEPTNDDKKNYMNFILNLQHILPCKKCRQNLKRNLKILPITINTMKNRETFSRYVYDLHEVVNKMLDKHSNLTFDDVRRKYEHFRASCSKKDVKEKKHRGCSVPTYGKKSKCIIKIVPRNTHEDGFQIHPKCYADKIKE